MTAFKDSGSRSEFGTGAVRDIDDNKGRFDLLPADAIRQLAMVFEVGAEKYSARNWENGIPLRRYIDSALRHIFCVLSGATDEPHLPMAMWNLACAIQTEVWIRRGKLPGCLRHEWPFDIRLLETGDVTAFGLVGDEGDCDGWCCRGDANREGDAHCHAGDTRSDAAADDTIANEKGGCHCDNRPPDREFID